MSSIDAAYMSVPSLITAPVCCLLLTNGKEKDIVAEFYSQDEWANLKMQVERDLEENASYNEIIMVQAAKEVYAKSKAIANEIPSLLGKTKTDRLENLIDYVGAHGKYVSITKSVTIHYPVEWLKGVEIVDTPGFNDPIVSRELRTQEFLKKADVVLMLLYAGRAFDATDRDILFEKVRKVGVGKILVGVNKYDLQIEKESEEQIISNVEEEIGKACRDRKYRDDFLIQETMRGIKPILVSANMALMAKMPLNKIYNDLDLKFHFDKSCKTFGNEKQDQQQMLIDSHIVNLENVQLLLTGPSEEVCFRALPITLLLFYLNPDSKKDRIIAVVISAFLFGLGHIGVMTFSIPWFQVCYAFVFGLAFGFVQLKTNSIIYPMIMHSVSNLISVGSSYLYMYISGKS